MTLQRIGALSTAKVFGTLYALLGLVFGAIVSLAGLLGFAAGQGSGNTDDAIFSLVFGVGAVIVLPLFYGAVGAISGLIGAPLYNLVARLVGGIELELTSD